MIDLLAQAKEFHKKNLFHKAKVLYEKLLESDPQNLAALEGLIDCLYNLGQTKDALEKSGEALKVDSTLVMPHIVLAYLYDDLGEIERSRAEAKTAITLSPDSAEALCCYGILLLIDKNIEQAILYLRRSTQANHGMYLAHYNLLLAYQQIQDRRSYHNQAKILFQLKPSVKNLIILLGSFILVNDLLRALIFLGPILLYLVNLRFFLALHIFLIFLYIASGIISFRNKHWPSVRRNFIMAIAFIIIDITTIAVDKYN